MNTSQLRTAYNYYGDLNITIIEELEKRIKKLERIVEIFYLLLIIKLNS